MDGWFIAFIVVGSLSLVAIGISWAVATRSIAVVVSIVLTLLSGLLFFLSTFTVVGAKDIGVPVTFGKPEGNVFHNGWNWKNPATAVHIFDGALQTERYSSDKDDQGDPIAVRLFTGSVAKVNVTFQWRLENDDNVKQVYMNYRNPENINVNLVKRALQQSLNAVFANYNPYTALITAQTSGTTNTPGTQQVALSYVDIQNTALSALKSELGSQGVSAVSLTISSIEYDNATQDNLNKLGNSITQTQIAIQNEKTADAQASANNKLNNSQASPSTIEQLCINATLEMSKEGNPPQGAWNCIAGSSNSSVVIPSK